MNKINESAGRNNYTENLYFSIPSFTIKKSLDFIRYSVDSRHHVKDLLTSNGFRFIKNIKLEKGLYENQKIFLYDGISVEVIQDVKRGAPMPFLPTLIKIRHPDKKVIGLFNRIFQSSKISEVEFTFDFFSDDLYGLYHFLESHLFLNYQRTDLISYSGEAFPAYYTNNLRKSAKGMRLYRHDEDHDEPCIRLELVLSRAVIKRLRLSSSVSKINSVNMSKFFSFKKVNTSRLRDYLIWKQRKEIEESNQRKAGHGDLLKRIIGSYINGHITDAPSLMRRIEVLKNKAKGVYNYSQFLEPYSELNDAFRSACQSGNFL